MYVIQPSRAWNCILSSAISVYNHANIFRFWLSRSWLNIKGVSDVSSTMQLHPVCMCKMEYCTYSVLNTPYRSQIGEEEPRIECNGQIGGQSIYAPYMYIQRMRPKRPSIITVSFRKLSSLLCRMKVRPRFFLSCQTHEFFTFSVSSKMISRSHLEGWGSSIVSTSHSTVKPSSKGHSSNGLVRRHLFACKCQGSSDAFLIRLSSALNPALSSPSVEITICSFTTTALCLQMSKPTPLPTLNG